MPLSAPAVLLLELSQSEVLDEPLLHQLCILPSSHLGLGLSSRVLPSK